MWSRTPSCQASSTAHGCRATGCLLRPSCHAFSVSRVALREGLKKLAMMDVVSIEQGRGTFVKGVDLGTLTHPMRKFFQFGDFDIKTIYDARLYIEIGTCRLAALHRSAEDLTALEHLHRRMREYYQALHFQSSAELRSLDAQFHIQIAVASKNEILRAIVMNMEAISSASARRMNKQQVVLRTFCEDHARILASIRARDPDAAEEAIVRHTLQSQHVLGADPPED